MARVLLECLGYHEEIAPYIIANAIDAIALIWEGLIFGTGGRI